MLSLNFCIYIVLSTFQQIQQYLILNEHLMLLKISKLFVFTFYIYSQKTRTKNVYIEHNAKCYQSSLFVQDVDANIHLSCIDCLYFPVRREKYLFDGANMR